MAVDAAIELTGVVKDFRGVRVLDGVDFVVPRGAITVLIGPSGAVRPSPSTTSSA